MTIGGFRVSEKQFIALLRLLAQGRIIGVGSDGAGGGIHQRTAKSLTSLGLIETFVPDAETWTMAARGRVRYYRLTQAGIAAAKGLKKLYKLEPVREILPSSRGVVHKQRTCQRVRVVDT
jgi:hypothetical protein